MNSRYPEVARLLRDALDGRSSRWLADLCGVSESTARAWCKGRIRPRPQALCLIASALPQLSVRELAIACEHDVREVEALWRSTIVTPWSPKPTRTEAVLEDDTPFGQVFEEEILRGAPQDAIARKLNLSQGQISQYVTGVALPGLPTLLMICRRFDRSPERLARAAGFDPIYAARLMDQHFVARSALLDSTYELIDGIADRRHLGESVRPRDEFEAIDDLLRERRGHVSSDRIRREIDRRRGRVLYEILACLRETEPQERLLNSSRHYLRALSRLKDEHNDPEFRFLYHVSRAYCLSILDIKNNALEEIEKALKHPPPGDLNQGDVQLVALRAMATLSARLGKRAKLDQAIEQATTVLEECSGLLSPLGLPLIYEGIGRSLGLVGERRAKGYVERAEDELAMLSPEERASPLLATQVNLVAIQVRRQLNEASRADLLTQCDRALRDATRGNYARFIDLIHKEARLAEALD